MKHGGVLTVDDDPSSDHRTPGHCSFCGRGPDPRDLEIAHGAENVELLISERQKTDKEDRR